MKKIIVLFLFSILSICSIAQANNNNSPVADFNEKTMGYESPKTLGKLFFESLKSNDKNLLKYFMTENVCLYMISLTNSKNKEQAETAAKAHWNEFAPTVKANCNATYDNLKKNGINLNSAVMDSIEYKIQTIPNTTFQATPIIIHFTFNGKHYSISLGDSGVLKGKWFLMTPNVKWVG